MPEPVSKGEALGGTQQWGGVGEHLKWFKEKNWSKEKVSGSGFGPGTQKEGLPRIAWTREAQVDGMIGCVSSDGLAGGDQLTGDTCSYLCLKLHPILVFTNGKKKSSEYLPSLILLLPLVYSF